LKNFLVNIKTIIDENIKELNDSLKELETYNEEIDEEDKLILGIKDSLESINIKIEEYLKILNEIIDNKRAYNEEELENLNKEIEEDLKALEELININQEKEDDFTEQIEDFYPVEEIDEIIENKDLNEKQKEKLLKDIQERLNSFNQTVDSSVEDILESNDLVDEDDLKKANILNDLLKSLDKAIEENNENKINEILEKINDFIKEY
jgi:DNA-binding ferritin-like protein